MDLLGDIFDFIWMTSQNRKMAEMSNEVDRLKQTAKASTPTDPLRGQLDDLRAANGELRLYIAVLFRVLVAKGVIGRDDLAKLVEQIDGEDGRQDKSFAGEVLP